MIRAISFGRKLKKIQRLYALFSLFAGWHVVTHARESQELKGIPGIGEYICGNDISTLEDKKFWGSQAKTARENEVVSRTAIEWTDAH